MNIIISGTVGVGKSTTFSQIKEILSTKTIPAVFKDEKIGTSNPMISLFYENRPEWSFLIQIDFLLDRFKAAINFEAEEKLYFYDRHFLDDYVWMKLPTVENDMSKFQINMYHQLSTFLIQRLTNRSQVDYIFLLKASLEETINRIKKRGRKEELITNRRYWEELYDKYYHDLEVTNYFQNNAKHFYVIEIDNLDPKEVANQILKIANII